MTKPAHSVRGKRPKLIFDETRPTRSSLTIRLTDEERSALQALANEVCAGNLSRAIRGLIRGLAPRAGGAK